MPLPDWLSLPKPDTSTGVASRSDINEVAPTDTQATVAAENAPLRVIYGRARVGAQIANVLVYGGKLVIQAVWGEGEIDAIESVTLGNEALPATVTATHYLGTTGQTVNATLVSAFAAVGIAYTDALPGIAYSVFQIPADASSGFPTFEATIRGRKVYDPRTATTAWSDNPALCLADFIGSTVYGLGRTTSGVDAAANECDALVGGQKRRLLGLAISDVAPTRQHIEALRVYAGVWLVDDGGSIKFVLDRPRATDHTVGPSDIVAGSLKLKKRGVADIPTVMDVRWTDTTVTPWAEKPAIVYAPGVLAGTTPRRESQVSLPGVQRYAQAIREATERLNHFLLEDLEVEWQQFDEALAIEPGDVVSLTHPIGLTAKLVRVTSVTATAPGRWKIEAREYDPAAYSDSVQAEPSTPDTSLPNPSAPPAISFIFAVEQVFQLENGTWASRLYAGWAHPTYPYVAAYRIEVYQAGALIHTGTTRAGMNWYVTPAVQEGKEYVVRVAVVTTIGAVGAWAQYNVTSQGKYLIPGDVPSVTAFEVGGMVFVSWDPAIDIDIWRYEVRYGTTGGTWDTAELIDRVDALRLTAEQIPVGTWKVWVKALDSVGQYSTNAASATVTVTSDANAFLVESYDSTTPTLTNMAAYTLAVTDPHTYYVTEDNAMFGTKYSSTLSTYTNALATYHASVTSTWLGESEDFGQLLGGQWTGTTTVAALNGTAASSVGFSTDAATWTYIAGLSHKQNARFARLKHEALTTATLHVTVPTQNIRLDAVPREEVGTGTSSASAATTVTLSNSYVATKKITVTPEGNTARMAVYDNIVMGPPTTFDVYVFDATGTQIASAFRWQYQGV